MSASGKKAHWRDFVRFINDVEFWKRWMFYLGPDIAAEEQYFIEHWAAARDGKNMPHFDFERTSVALMAKDGHYNMELDGEHCSKHFEAWFKNPKV